MSSLRESDANKESSRRLGSSRDFQLTGFALRLKRTNSNLSFTSPWKNFPLQQFICISFGPTSGVGEIAAISYQQIAFRRKSSILLRQPSSASASLVIENSIFSSGIFIFHRQTWKAFCRFPPLELEARQNGARASITFAVSRLGEAFESSKRLHE
jgi:hypothetical protein